MMSRYSTNCVQMRQGLGKMNSDTSKALQMICHNMITATSRIHGDQISTNLRFLLFMVGISVRSGGCVGSSGCAPADGANVATQLQHHVGEFFGVGQL